MTEIIFCGTPKRASTVQRRVRSTESYASVRSVQLISSCVRLGQSFKTAGYGCTSCWGDVGAGDVEADVFYISFIVSVQYIGY